MGSPLNGRLAMTEFKSHREVLGKNLVEMGGEESSMLVLSPDVGSSTKALDFSKAFPNRYICTGISEQNTIGMAAGLAYMGWKPVVTGYAMFIVGKTWEPLRNSVCYPHLDVKIIATHGGINVGEDGVTHQAIEDIAITRVIPGMTVLSPCDADEILPLLKLAFRIKGPVYIRLERQSLPLLTNGREAREIGGSLIMREGKDAAIMAVGGMVSRALSAAETLADEGIQTRVLNMYSLKPIDESAIRKAADETSCIVTAEDHNCLGGLGSAVAEVLVRGKTVPMDMVGVRDTFAESGSVKSLYEKYHLTSSDIVAAVKGCLKK